TRAGSTTSPTGAPRTRTRPGRSSADRSTAAISGHSPPDARATRQLQPSVRPKPERRVARSSAAVLARRSRDLSAVVSPYRSANGALSKMAVWLAGVQHERQDDPAATDEVLIAIGLVSALALQIREVVTTQVDRRNGLEAPVDPRVPPVAW